MRKTFMVLAMAVAMTLPGHSRADDEYPSKPVRLVVSYAAGNVTDTLARIVGQRLSERWKQPVIVENRPGQGGSFGAQGAAKAPPDGYTLLVSAMAAMAINPHVYPSLGYDPLKDFVPVAGMAYPNGLLFVGADTKANTLDELVRLSKASPGTMNYGSTGSGTVPHLNMELIKRRTGLDATHIPYKAATAVLADVVGGSIQVAQEAVSVVLPQVRSGRVKPIAVLTPRRLSQFPNVPAIAEAIPGFEPVTPWLGVFAPAGVPPAVVERIHAAVSATLREPATIEKLSVAGLEVLDASPAEFGKLLARDHERLGRLVRELKLKAD